MPVHPGISSLRVPVTEEIISGACVADSSHCMIADAIRAAVPDARNISVDVQTIRFSLYDWDERIVYLTPRQGQEALLDFDAGETPDPFVMTLRTPMVTRMRRPAAHKQKPLSEQSSERQAAVEKMRAFSTRQPYNRAEIKPGSGEHTSAPARIGGQVPPTGALYSGRGSKPRGRNGEVALARRRQFGLRAMERRADRGPRPE